MEVHPFNFTRSIVKIQIPLVLSLVFMGALLPIIEENVTWIFQIVFVSNFVIYIDSNQTLYQIVVTRLDIMLYITFGEQVTVTGDN